jgi:hypothetical protein
VFEYCVNTVSPNHSSSPDKYSSKSKMISSSPVDDGNDVVLVDHEDAVGTTKTAASNDDKDVTDQSGPSPLQIVSIGTEEDQFAFTFHEDKLDAIMSKIPPGWKVAVVAVVGTSVLSETDMIFFFPCRQAKL